MVENMQLHSTGRVRTWASHWRQCVRECLPGLQLDVDGRLQAIDEEALLRGLERVVWNPLDGVVGGDPRHADVAHRQLVTYKSGCWPVLRLVLLSLMGALTQDPVE